MIELNSVCKSYTLADSTVSVLQSLNLSVSNGDSVAIVGPSGSGKSTLLLILTGLENATSGTVQFDGQDLARLNADECADLRRDQIGIVFQSFHLIPSLSARENVALPLDISGATNTHRRALEMLDRVGLSDRADHYPAQLSGGEQQRIAMARALVHKPGLIVADEPTGNLDSSTGESIMNLLFDLNKDAGTTLLLVTHDMQVSRRCDRTMRLQDGRLTQVSHSDSAGQPHEDVT